MAHIVRKILYENRPSFGSSSDIVPDGLNGQAWCCFFTGHEAWPQGIFSLIPCLAKRFVEAVKVPTLAHHPFKSG
jgi:hypothetical protein